MNFKNRSIISIKDISKQEILYILKTIGNLKTKPRPNLLSGKIMASLFFEPSTRTRLSTEAAMLKLGGQVIGFADPAVKKKDSLYDTVKIISGYADVIAIRHYFEGAAQLASEASEIPVINCGDGSNQHPTQTLLDLFTIQETQKKINKLHVAMVGDLKYGRTVHSMSSALTHFNARLYFVAPESLQMPQEVLNELKVKGIKYSLHENISDVVKKVDILYMTRIQEERFPDKFEYEKVKNVYVLKPSMLKGVKQTMKILHPLPRVNEIDMALDTSRHAHYFQQAQNGLYTRQAILGLILGKL
jgi:aspartate carbamoyltransferase catalytic subunit